MFKGSFKKKNHDCYEIAHSWQGKGVIQCKDNSIQLVNHMCNFITLNLQ